MHAQQPTFASAAKPLFPGAAAPPRPLGLAKLSGAEIEERTRALLSAFTTRPALARMLRVRLDKKLDEIAGSGNLHGAAFEVVITAEAHGFVDELFVAALAEVPKNAALLAIADKRRG